jgi:hypothetical protein
MLFRETVTVYSENRSNAKVGRERFFKPTIGNGSLHEISNDNGVKTDNQTDHILIDR